MRLSSVHLFMLDNKKLNSNRSDNAFLIEIISNKLAVLLKKRFLQKKKIKQNKQQYYYFL